MHHTFCFNWRKTYALKGKIWLVWGHVIVTGQSDPSKGWSHDLDCLNKEFLGILWFKLMINVPRKFRKVSKRFFEVKSLESLTYEMN